MFSGLERLITQGSNLVGPALQTGELDHIGVGHHTIVRDEMLYNFILFSSSCKAGNLLYSSRKLAMSLSQVFISFIY
jgi:hypothetical protein